MRASKAEMRLLVVIIMLCIFASYLPGFAASNEAEIPDAPKEEITVDAEIPDVSEEEVTVEMHADIAAEENESEDETDAKEKTDSEVSVNEKETDEEETNEKDVAKKEIYEKAANEKEIDEKADDDEADNVKKNSEGEDNSVKTDEPQEEQVILIDGTNPAAVSRKAVGGVLKSASTGSKLDPTKIKKVSWVHSAWSWLITAQNNKADGTHVRKITSIKDDEGNELLDQDGVTAGYVYCTEPGTNTPEDLHFGHQFSASDGEYEAINGDTVQGKAQVIRAFNKESAAAAGTTYVKMRKLLYYLPGGDGWKSTTKVWYTSYKNSHGLGATGENPGVTGYHELAHMALSKLWRSEGKAEHPVGDRWNADQLYSFCDTATKNLIDRYVDYALDPNTEDPPEDFIVLFVSTHDAQDMWGVLGTLEEDTGWIQLKKEDKKTHYNHPEKYNLSGAVYYIYNDADCTRRARDVEGEKAELTTKSDGSTNKVELEVGTYWVKENSAPDNFLKDNTVHKAEVTIEDSEKKAVLVLSDEPVETGHICLRKKPEKPVNNQSGNYSLSGAVYYVYKDSACTKRAKNTSGKEIELITDSKGITQTEEVDIGKYWVKEITPSPGFSTDGSVKTGTVTGAHTDKEPLEFTSLEPFEYGYLRAEKEYKETLLNHPEKYKLSGAEYEVFSDAGLTKRAKDSDGKDITLVTDAKGVTQTVQLEPGSYWLKESKASEGCKADDDLSGKEWIVKKGTDPAKATVAHSQEPTEEGWFYLKKSSANTNTAFTDETPNNYSLAGAVYYVYTDSACSKRALDRDSKKEIVLTTDAKGNTNSVKVDIGDYYAREVTAPKGFKLDTSVNGGRPVGVTEDNTQKNPAAFTSTEQPVYKDFEFSFEKSDKSGNYGYKKLLGCEFTLSYYDVDMDYGKKTPDASTVSGIKPKRTWTWVTVMKRDKNNKPYAGFNTSEDAPKSGSSPFYTEGGKKIMPRGVFTLKETKAASGLARNETVYYGRVYQSEKGANAELYFDLGENPSITVNLFNEPQYPVVEIRKQDAETEASIAQGGDREYVKGSFAGAEFAVYFDDDTLPAPERVGTIITDENGYGKLDARTEGDERKLGERLEPGQYLIEEIKAPPGYTLDKLGYEEEKGVYENGKHVIRARVRENDTASFTYTVISKEYAHKTHISKKDITSGEELPGAALQLLDSEGNLIEEWVSDKEPHDIMALHDETQGLKSGKYVLREITAPYGYDIAEDVEFTVAADRIENSVEMMNKPIKVETTAADGLTGTHAGSRNTDGRIVDNVKINGLVSGRKYKVTGTLMDKNSGEALLDSEGNSIMAETEFTASDEEMEIEVEFPVDSSDFSKDVALVVFEQLFRTEAIRENEEMPRLLGGHEDMGDETQTVHYGGIASTAASGKADNSHNIIAEKEAVVADTVSYLNLATDESYMLSGELFDKTTGELTGIKSDAEFSPEKPDGTVDMEFKFDSSAFKGHTLVVYETLSAISHTDGESKSIIIDEHRNPDDKDQTVYIPEIRTTAAAEKSGHITMAKEDIVVTDSVIYKSLEPGKEYTVKGKLVYKENGNDVINEGKTVTAEKKFVPDESDGEVQLEFRFSGVDLQGKTVVAFEECYEKDILVGTHADLNDEDQSVHIPSIHTEALDTETKDHIGVVSDKNTITDSVAYTNLIPGKEYIMKGTIIQKSTGEAVKADGKDVTSELKFTPEQADGTVDLSFEVSGAELRGDSVVAYEECWLGDVIIAVHADINDENQTVHLPEIRTTATDSKTHRHIGSADKKITVEDEVKYSNLVPGKKYRVCGTLINKSTGKALKDGDKEIKAEKIITPKAADGSVTLKFLFDASRLRGETVVAYEKLYYNDILIAAHDDINDSNQTVHIPEIKTNANDLLTKDHIGDAAEKTEIIDRVKYRNLMPGREYRMTGTLMNKKTRKPVRDNGKIVKTVKKFVPPAADGEVELKFNLNTKNLKGETVVAFEECTYRNVPVAVHMNIEDEDQSVHIPEIKTTVNAPENGTAVDTVKYTNLIPGKEYVMRGWIVDKASGDRIADSEGETRFTPEKPDGTVDVKLTIGDISGEAVAFEECYFVIAPDSNGHVVEVLVGKHTDIKSRAQTIGPASKTTSHPDTGDRTMLMLWLAVAVCSAALMAIIIRKISVKENV